KNAREYIKYSLRFLFHLTKNLTTHLSHNLCAVLPFVFTEKHLCRTGTKWNFCRYRTNGKCHFW
ncbi:MAG TPA: hypothetical protein DEQ76_03425, partial [Ruminococcus sp.]|nr:hypothetical protein [Ruminococcus sp.]